MSVIVFKDMNGVLYGFCSRKCLDDWRHAVCCPYCPLAVENLPKDVSCGCWCCGADLLNREGIQWLDFDSLKL